MNTDLAYRLILSQLGEGFDLVGFVDDYNNSLVWEHMIIDQQQSFIQDLARRHLKMTKFCKTDAV